MVSVCYDCTYSTEGMQYCGKGMTTKVSTCSGYAHGKVIQPWSMQPRCRFPVTEYSHRLGQGTIYRIVSYNPALRYLMTYRAWPRYTINDVWKLHILFKFDDLNEVHLISASPWQLIARVPKSLWWLDPTLSNEEVVPMCALLIAVVKHTAPTRISKGCIKLHEYRHTLMCEALHIGLQCKGRPIEDWAAAIMQGPVPHWVISLLGMESNHSDLWGAELHQQWVSTMDAMYNVVGGQHAM